MTRLTLVKQEQFTPIQDFYNSLIESDRSSSAKGYTGDVIRFAVWFNCRGQFSPQAVSTLDIVEYRAWLQNEGSTGKGLAPSTVNRNLNSIKAFYKFCIKQKYVEDDPAEPVKLVATAKKSNPKWLERNEQAALMRAVREFGNLRDETIIVTFLHTGPRVSELSGLRWIHIKINPRSGKVAFTGKGNKYREVPLNITARRVLTKWAEYHKHSETDFVFPGHNGALDPRSIRNIISKYAHLAHLDKVSPHKLRHTFCKNLVDRMVPITEVALMAGHSTLEIAKIYTVPSDKDLQKSVEKTAWE